MSTTSSESPSTVHYAKPSSLTLGSPSQSRVSHHQTSSPNTSHNSSSSHGFSRSSNIRFPKVVVQVPHSSTSPVVPNSTASVSYAVPFRRAGQYSTAQLQCETMKQRCQMLDLENQRLMCIQTDVVNDANRRVEMHINEIRMLKEEIKKQSQGNKDLRDLCCFLDDDRQKTRRLAREWQKFGRYTSNLMKQEVHAYHAKQAELEERLTAKEREADELKQLCLYLDEQRQALFAQQHRHVQRRHDDEESEDLGCGSSERSEGSDDDPCTFNKSKEKAIRLISEQMQTSMTSSTTEAQRRDVSNQDSTRILDYIQSLENRIKNLEIVQGGPDAFWNSSSNIGSDCDEKTIIERWDEERLGVHIASNPATTKADKNMLASTTSTMTSSGTTYGSSETDGESAVFVMGDELDIGSLEVRTLSRIDEEKTDSERFDRRSRIDDELEESGKMPPVIAPVSQSLLSVTRLSLNNDFLNPNGRSLMRSASESCQPTVAYANGNSHRCSSVESHN